MIFEKEDMSQQSRGKILSWTNLDRQTFTNMIECAVNLKITFGPARNIDRLGRGKHSLLLVSIVNFQSSELRKATNINIGTSDIQEETIALFHSKIANGLVLRSYAYIYDIRRDPCIQGRITHDIHPGMVAQVLESKGHQIGT